MTEGVSDYLARQRAVAERQLAEERALGTDAKIAVLASLMASVGACRLGPALSEGDEVIWQRWQALRRRLGAAS